MMEDVMHMESSMFSKHGTTDYWSDRLETMYTSSLDRKTETNNLKQMLLVHDLITTKMILDPW